MERHSELYHRWFRLKRCIYLVGSRWPYTTAVCSLLQCVVCVNGGAGWVAGGGEHRLLKVELQGLSSGEGTRTVNNRKFSFL